MSVEHWNLKGNEALFAWWRHELEAKLREVDVLSRAIRDATDRAQQRQLRERRGLLLREADRLAVAMLRLEQTRCLSHPTFLLDMGQRGNSRLA